MLLAIDVGNTNIAFGIHHDGHWISHWRIRTVPDQMPDEYAVLFRELFRDSGIDMDDIHRAVLSSVVPPVTGALTSMLHQQTQQKPLVLGPGVRTGILEPPDTVNRSRPVPAGQVPGFETGIR